MHNNNAGSGNEGKYFGRCLSLGGLMEDIKDNFYKKRIISNRWTDPLSTHFM